jgi:O-methyltransferase domain
MDVGGGNGILLAAILKAHPGLRGVLADLPHTLERATDRGFLGGELASRSTMSVPETSWPIAAVRFPKTAPSCWSSGLWLKEMRHLPASSRM